jgi:hypothetical protein
MSDLKIDLPAGQIRFVDSYQPGVKDGTYEIRVKQTVSAAGVSVPDLAQRFLIAGPRFEVDHSEIHAEFPPKGASSQFADVLPHVVINKRLLPWERVVPGLPDSAPWMALLVFQDGELIGDENDSKTLIANYAQTMTVGKLLGNASATVRTPKLDPNSVSTDEKAMNCQVITISNTTFAQIVPTGRELRYLAHARQVDTTGKALFDMKDDGLFSVVVANRFPRPGDETRAAKTIVHLVSLEGFGDLLGSAAPVKPSQAQVQLISLLSWSFSCLAEPSQKFSGLAQNLAYDATGKLRPAASLTLNLPFTPSSATDAATVSAQNRLASGYVALGYHTQTGEDSFAWFRGPLTPVISNAVPKSGAFETSSAAMIYDPKSGVFDNSLAAAWQCGRSLALADQAYATTLMRLRQKANAQLDQIAGKGGVSSAPSQQAGHARLAALFSGAAVQTIRQVSTEVDLPMLRRPLKAKAAPRPVKVLRNLVTQPDVLLAMAQQASEDPDGKTVAHWLGQLQLLYGVPFMHLVPDERMLPPESMRFFYVDPNWISALTDGAVSIGLGSSKESATQAALTQQLQQMAATVARGYRAGSLRQDAPPPANGPNAGLLIRSALISGWPGLVVRATKGGNAVTLLRADHLASGVLFCLFNGVPDTVTLAEPHEGLEFGVADNGRITTRVVSAPTVRAGSEVAIYDPQNPTATMPTLRAGGLRVLNINNDPSYPTSSAPANPTDLLGSIAKALNRGTRSLGPADFAMQMVKGPEEITFSFNPPPKS